VSDNTNTRGFTIVELVIAVVVAGILITTLLTVTFSFYGNSIRNSTQARLAVESQNILRTIVEELRVSSGVRDTNTITDPNGPAGGWTTSNASLVLIISTPVMDSSNKFVINTATGDPYQNEIVYYATNKTLYKRYLANAAAPGNQFKTSCPIALATDTCPADVILSRRFKDMRFVFYDQDDAVTTTLVDARSVKMTIDMIQDAFGQTVEFTNNIRMTMRNSL
jgi:prepilin-type N-terminal cleavage/methylation domain-containing protein